MPDADPVAFDPVDRFEELVTEYWTSPEMDRTEAEWKAIRALWSEAQRQQREWDAAICRCPNEYLGGPSSTRKSAWQECEAAIRAQGEK